ncbi:MAG: hypothetical protein JWR25_272 [Noviherbaspirillum sp.]|nr:hypothetical protein [Noviherbaspirillum sp.]
MRNRFLANPRHRMLRLLLACIVCVDAALVSAAAGTADDAGAAALRAKYAELEARLADNQFKRPLHLESIESPKQLEGDIYAVVDHPFANVSAALKEPAQWCEVLILHLNTKYCRPHNGRNGPGLSVAVGKKHDQPLNDAYQVEFGYSVAALKPDYFDIRLGANNGPMGTSDYRIRLEAVPLREGKSFLHLTYSYSYNLAARIAMQGYLATVGRDKVGFTRAPSGRSDHIGGVRGVVERNTMRYYLAIDAYLGALSSPAPEQFEKRLNNWFTSTERFPRQLHEIDRQEYLVMKRSEYARQQNAR